MSALQVFLGYVQTQDGCAYVWRGKGETLLLEDGVLHRHGFGENVFDCSGLVTRALKEAGHKDLRATHSADVMFKEFAKVESPEPGDLAFYGMLDHATHVEVCMGEGRLFGAIGGSKHSVVPNAEKARVRYRLTARPDLIGFRRNPLREDKP